MKETISVNVGSRAFVLDKDAYERLRGYLNDVRSRIVEEPDEVMSDVEVRLAELFAEWRPSPMMVVTLQMVERAIMQMGEPEAFGPRCGGGEAQCEGSAVRGVRRAADDRVVAGVCSGLARYFDVDVTVLRLVTLFLILFGGLSLWVYVLLWIVIPKE